MPKHRIIYIIGFMGSGKSTAGKKLASALNWSFVDLDKSIEEFLGKSIDQVFSESGELFFRKTESEVLRNLLISCDTVVSAGGGTPCFADNMDFMKRTGQVVYLKMTPGQLAARLSENRGQRPLLKHKNEGELKEYIKGELAEREKFYNQATIVIHGIDLDIKSLIKNINNSFNDL